VNGELAQIYSYLIQSCARKQSINLCEDLMLDQILALVREYGETTIVNNPAVPNEHNEAALNSASQSIVNGIQGAVSQGQLPQLLALLGSSENLMNSPMIKEMIASFGEQLKSQFSVAPEQASSVASDTIPKVLSGVLAQLGNANKGGTTDLMGMAQAFLSGQGNAGASSLTAALDVNKDGSVDLQDAL
jgi:hypothetical protein